MEHRPGVAKNLDDMGIVRGNVVDPCDQGRIVGASFERHHFLDTDRRLGLLAACWDEGQRRCQCISYLDRYGHSVDRPLDLAALVKVSVELLGLFQGLLPHELGGIVDLLCW